MAPNNRNPRKNSQGGNNNNANNANGSNNVNNENNVNYDPNHNILDIIAERTSNIEFINVLQLRQQTLSKNIKNLGRREALLRDTTITISHNKLPAEIINNFEQNWVEKLEQAPLVYWQDLDNLYVQFPNQINKLEFLEMYTSKPNDIISTNGASLLPPNPKTKQHISRKPVKCEISNVSPKITASKINNILNQTIHHGEKIINVREGKQHGNNFNRTIMFTVDAKGLERIIDDMDGHVQFNQPTLNIKTQLNIKVNCKPWQCKLCLKLGKHECAGQLCGNCGSKGHLSKECHSKRRHCSNCNKPGHRAKDSHCQIYQNEVIKELRKMDIPTDFMIEKEKRVRLISLLHVA